MESGKVNNITVLGQIMMYGTLVLSLYKNNEQKYFIDIDYAPDGCAMINDDSKEIDERQFLLIVHEIQDLIQRRENTEDEGCSDCLVEIMYDNEKVETFTWPEELHSCTFRAIGELINGVVNNEVASDFLSMF